MVDFWRRDVIVTAMMICCREQNDGVCVCVYMHIRKKSHIFLQSGGGWNQIEKKLLFISNIFFWQPVGLY